MILGKAVLDELCELGGKRVKPGSLVKYVFQYFMSIGQNLTNTEGMLDSGSFPINYFAVRQLFYFFPDVKEKLAASIAESDDDA